MGPERSGASQDGVLPGGRPFYGFDLGIILLENTCPRPVGDVGNAKTWPFPVLYDIATGADPESVVEHSAYGLLDSFVASAHRLAARGVRAIGTACGFVAIYQRELAAAVPVPVATSSLLQIPTVLRLIGPHGRVGVLTANAAGLTDQHFAGIGLTPPDRSRLQIVGLEHTEHLYPALVQGALTLDAARARDEVITACTKAMTEHPDTAAWVFECTNLPPYREATRAATGLPVFDAVTLFTWLHAGTQT